MYIYPLFQSWPKKIYSFIKAKENYVIVSFLASPHQPQLQLQINPRHAIAPPINRWQCSVCDAEGESGSGSAADPCEEEGCFNHGSNLGRWQLGCKWAAVVETGAELRLLPAELKINIILHLYYRHLADARVLCDKNSRIELCFYIPD